MGVKQTGDEKGLTGRGKGQTSIYRTLSPVLFLVTILFLTFLARVIFSPLLVPIEADLHLSHAEAGSFFLLISIGFAVTMLGSGFVSERITHRGTIFASVLICGLALLMISLSTSLTGIRFGLVALGMGAGLYFPSAMATITRLVDSAHWGKAIALHEVGPTMGFVFAPIIAELGLNFTSWRGVVVVVGVGCLVAAAIFGLFGKGGRFTGEPPRLGNIGLLFSQSSFWIIAILMSLAAGASVGVYAILPVYLIDERAMEQGVVNTLVGLSRVSGLITLFLAGWLTDRFGVKLVMVSIYAIAGVLTGLLGLATNVWLVIVVFLQPAIVTSFFPVALLALANIGPPHIQNVAISLMIPFVFLFGGGIVPAGMGIMAEYRGFATGFILMGGLLLANLVLLIFLRIRPTSTP